MDDEIDIFLEDELEKLYILQVPKRIKNKDLIEIIKNKTKKKNFYVIYKNKKYEDENEILNLSSGDRIYIEKNIILENATECNFHLNVNLNDDDQTYGDLSGILQLCLLKYIARNLNNLSLIKNSEIRDIIHELKEGVQMTDNPQKDIKESLSQKNGNNILTYMNYIKEVINRNEIDNLINLFDENEKKQIISFWSILSKYQDFNILFEKDFSKIIEKSYFDYSLIGISIYQGNRKEYIDGLRQCDNCEVRYLLHGTKIDPISLIITNGFEFAKKPFYGLGVYFSDMIDYISFYCGGVVNKKRAYWKKILPVGQTISCVGTEVFYSKDKKKYIFDDSYYLKTFDHFPNEEDKKKYENKMVEDNGIHFVRVEPAHGQVLKSENDVEKARKEGKFIGTEYVISQKKQMLPLYGLTLKRNEFFIIWRDGNFQGENKWKEYLKGRKMFIYKTANMNVFFESNMEKALELIKRKKYNKIILISSCQGEVGEKFVNVARKILGFDIVVLFYSANKKNLSWIQKYPNALYTNNEEFYKKFITNYNLEGLKQLKKEMENYYDCQLNLNDNCLDYPYPKLAENQTYDNLLFEEINPYFRRVMIKNKSKKMALVMENKKPHFLNYDGLNTNNLIWYITIINDEITLFSNGFYLYIDNYQNIVGSEFMKGWKYEKINSYYMLYVQDQYFTLTLSGDNAILSEKDNKNYQQFFTFFDI